MEEVINITERVLDRLIKEKAKERARRASSMTLDDVLKASLRIAELNSEIEHLQAEIDKCRTTGLMISEAVENMKPASDRLAGIPVLGRLAGKAVEHQMRSAVVRLMAVEKIEEALDQKTQERDELLSLLEIKCGE